MVDRNQFVEDHKGTFEVTRMLEVIGIPRSSYYDWVAAADGRAERALADDELAAKIVVIQDPKADGDPAYGVPRVTAELNDKNPDGDKVNHKKVHAS